MRKLLLTTALAMGATLSTQAGGFLTNTNQSVAFLRNPARDAYIAIDAAYSNPAGIGFMQKGWHMGFNIQSAYQTRKIDSFFPAFAQGIVNGENNPLSGMKHFEGKATAPVIPSLSLARVGDKWFASFHFGITGGGGKCKFDDGLGSFESQVAMLPSLISLIKPGFATGYTMDTKMQGRQYYFGGQFNLGYKITPNLSVSVGGRVVYADCNYYGYVRNIGIQTPIGNIPASTFFTEMAGYPDFEHLVTDKELNCDQTGWGFTPILGIDYKIGNLNLAAKYEFKTRLRLENRSGDNTSGLEEFDDGKKIAADIPAMLTLGANYEILPCLRLSTGFHYYFDKQATQFNHKEDKLKKGTWEVLAGAEYDINKRWTVSAGWQSTHYGLGKNSDYITDMSFVTNSNSIGLGARFQLFKKVALNVAYFKTFYKHYDRQQSDYNHLAENFTKQLTGLGGKIKTSIVQNSEYMAKIEAWAQKNNISIEDNKLANAHYNMLKNQNVIYGEELKALGMIQGGAGHLNTAGFDNFHRSSDVFGVGLEIDF